MLIQERGRVESGGRFDTVFNSLAMGQSRSLPLSLDGVRGITLRPPSQPFPFTKPSHTMADQEGGGTAKSGWSLGGLLNYATQTVNRCVCGLLLGPQRLPLVSCRF